MLQYFQDFTEPVIIYDGQRLSSALPYADACISLAKILGSRARDNVGSVSFVTNMSFEKAASTSEIIATKRTKSKPDWINKSLPAFHCLLIGIAFSLAALRYFVTGT